jgi:alkylated DNA nucleotide flippase Atl1
MPATTLLDLSQPERDVLQLLVQARVTPTIVTLAADLWRTTSDWEAEDPYPLLGYLLDSLSSHGLVKYKVADETGSVANYARDVPYDIRLTQQGWALMGYPLVHREVGRGRELPINAPGGDATNFRNHGYSASGGDIVKEDIHTHRLLFPHHIHILDGEDMMNTKRPYNKMTPEIEATVLAARMALGDTARMSDIADMTGLPERQVRYVLTDLPRLRRMDNGEGVAEGSLKQRIVWTLEALPELRTVDELRRVLGMSDTAHDVVHVLHSLHKEGKVDFREGRNGNQPENIHLTARGKGEGLKPEVRERVHESVQDKLPKDDNELLPTETGVMATVESVPLDLDPEALALTITYPHLWALQEREANRKDHDTASTAYLTAAEAIEKVDPEAARMLVEKANALEVTFPSPLEQEYLRYVEEHP